MSLLVIAGHSGGKLADTSLEAVAAALELSACSGEGETLRILLAGSDCGEAARHAAGIAGTGEVLVLEHPALENPVPENVAPSVVSLVRELAREGGHTTVLAPATGWGKALCPRVAALLGVAQVSEMSAIRERTLFERPIYAGNAILTVRTRDPVQVITVRTTSFSARGLQHGQQAAPVRCLPPPGIDDRISFVSRSQPGPDRPVLSSARVVVSGGRGLQSAGNFAMIGRLADLLGGAVGASRAAVDAGYAPNDLQVGQTGKVVAPDLYIAIGISGAIQHLAGMKDSRVIVAINRDEEAPIFQVADYGLVGDLFTIVPQLERALAGEGQGNAGET